MLEQQQVNYMLTGTLTAEAHGWKVSCLMSTEVGQHVLRLEHVGNITIIELTCNKLVDDASIAEMADELLILAKNGSRRKFLLDFHMVTRLSSTVLAKLIGFRRIVQATGSQLALCAIRNEIYPVFEITGLSRLFRIYQNEEEALQALMDADVKPTEQ
jgi:anti-sigma B factor antagonist